MDIQKYATLLLPAIFFGSTFLCYAPANEISTIVGATSLIITEGDILTQPVQAIVNAANASLLGGSGIDGVIHKAAGPDLLNECKQILAEDNGDRCPTGQARLTKAHNITEQNSHIQSIVHTVGPLGSNPNREMLLADAYKNSLITAQNNGITSIAFPAISSGIYGYDVTDAAPIALKAIKNFVTENPSAFKEIRIVVRCQDMSSKKGTTFFETYKACLIPESVVTQSSAPDTQSQAIDNAIPSMVVTPNNKEQDSFIYRNHKAIIITSLLAAIGGTYIALDHYKKKHERRIDESF